MKHLSFNATISAVNAETLALDAETSTLGAATSAFAGRYRHRVFSDCGVGVTLQLCNRVTNHGDMASYGYFFQTCLKTIENLRIKTIILLKNKF